MESCPQLYMLISADTPRMRYVGDLLFRRLLGITVAFVEETSTLPENCLLMNYTSRVVPGAFSIPNAGLLGDSDLKPVDPQVDASGAYPLLFFNPDQRSESSSLQFDVFSASFFLATEYEKWTRPGKDIYDRHKPEGSCMNREQLYRWPLVHLYAESLWTSLVEHFPSLDGTRRPKRPFSYELTFDIDHARKYQHKSVGVQVGGFIKAMFRLDGEQLRERLSVWMGKKDPFDTFAEIETACNPAATSFFFLIERRHAHDGRFTHRTPFLRKLIQRLYGQGYRVGIHPSYTTYRDEEQIREECEALGKLIGAPVHRSRQHFLRYRLPDTFRYLLRKGIREEYSLCAYGTGGFPTGLAVEYPWFDLEADQVTELMLYPTLIMDRTLQQYLQLGPLEAESYVRQLIQHTREIGGHFVILLHNDVLSESGEWKGWRAPILRIIESLQKGS